MKQKISRLLMTLALLITAVGGAWAQDTYNVTFKANGNTKTVENVTLPHTFKCDGWTEEGELDHIMKELYGLSKGCCRNDAPTSSGSEKVTCGIEDDNQFITISAPFEGTATVNGIYEGETYQGFYYSLEITCAVHETTEWSLTPDETGKNWTLAKMPASNIELQVEYYAESNLFLSKDALADKTKIAVKAGDLGVQFGNDGKSANTVTEGTPMTVTYNGTKKLLGMKVEKKKEESLIVNPVVGQIIGSDGKNYDANATLPDGVTKVAMIAYLGNGSDCTNGLAIQLNGNPVSMKWAQAKTYVEGLTAVPGGTWRLPSKADWQNMIVGCVVAGDATVPDANNEMNPIAGFQAKIAATGISWPSGDFWTSTGDDSTAWIVGVKLDGSYASASFGEIPSDFAALNVLACLAF